MKIHLWLSVPVGLVFCMMCLTGAILVFEDEVTEWVYSGREHISDPGDKPLTTADIEKIVAGQVDSEWVVKEIVASDSPSKAYKAVFSNPKRMAVYVDQYTGRVIAECGRLPFFSKTMALHRWFLDAPKSGSSIGKKVTGWSTVATFFIVVSGFFIWLPKSGKSFVARLTVKTHPKSAFWHTLHAAGGFYALAALLVMILTGLTWSFPAYREAVVAVVGNLPFKTIHTGTWLGIASKIVWFVAALVGAMLPLTGYYLWFRRLRRAK